MNKFLVIIVLLISETSFSQKGTFLSASYNFFASRSFGEIAIQKRKANGYSFSFALGFGELGKRMYNNKTKDLFGRTFSPYDYGKTFFYMQNRGVNFSVSYNYQFELSKIIRIEVGFSPLLEFYQQYYTSDLNQQLYVDGILEDVDNEATHYHVNFAFGFNVNSTFRVAKKSYILLGINMPFHVLNKDKFPVSKYFDAPLLGFEPVFRLGYVHKIGY